MHWRAIFWNANLSHIGRSEQLNKIHYFRKITLWHQHFASKIQAKAESMPAFFFLALNRLTSETNMFGISANVRALNIYGKRPERLSGCLGRLGFKNPDLTATEIIFLFSESIRTCLFKVLMINYTKYGPRIINWQKFHFLRILNSQTKLISGPTHRKGGPPNRDYGKTHSFSLIANCRQRPKDSPFRNALSCRPNGRRQTSGICFFLNSSI